jgi:protein disulfide-isomerase A6
VHQSSILTYDVSAFFTVGLFPLGILTIVLIAQGSWALYPSSSDVVELTPSNFDKLVLKSDGIWIVEFFAPWCGHCKSLVPEYLKAAKALKASFNA